MKAMLHALTMLLFAASIAVPASAGEKFRTDINPALLYWQAFGAWPALPEPEHDHLFTNQWQGRTLDEATGRQLAKFDDSFKLICRGAKAQARCDWGYDLTDGPEALLPSLAKAKSAANTARLRVLWHLQKGNQTAARDELIGVFALGRNLATDGILISALVQFAIENIAIASVAENLHQFQPEILRQILAGFASAPPRGSIAQCIPAERHSFAGWLLRKIEWFKAEGSSDSQAVARMRDVMARSFSEGEPDFALADRIVSASGGTTAGLASYIRDLEPLYDRADRLMILPYDQFVPQIKSFNETIHSHTNLLVSVFFPIFENCRGKEFAAEVTLAMLRAGIAFKLDGEQALAQIQDPVFKAPFALSRQIVDGTDRGYVLSSKLETRGFPERLVFIEKPGPPVAVIGKNAGKLTK